MKNITKISNSVSEIFKFEDLDDLRYKILRHVFVANIVIIIFSLIQDLRNPDDLSKSIYIGLPIILVSILGLYILSKSTLDITIYVTFILMYIGIYSGGVFHILNAGFVILVLNMILILILFLIKNRISVIIICVFGVLCNLVIIGFSPFLVHEYLIGSLAFNSFFYGISTLIYKYQERLITENKNIKSKNQEIEILLQEIHHRVKNNLQTISSILYLQSIKISDSQAKEAIRQGQLRIESMALIHKSLYQQDNLSGIEMKNYITNLVDNTNSAHGEGKNIKVHVEMNQISIDIDTAIPLGLMLNEILTNQYVYAFDNHENGKINISMKINEIKNYVINITHNGAVSNSTKNIFGNKLIEILAKQINATFQEDNNKGYRCDINL